MNNRFKFRVWDKEKKWLVYFDFTNIYGYEGEISGVISPDGYTIITFNPDQNTPGINTDLVFMQSTGLKDKNGKLVYEKDIIETPYYMMGNAIDTETKVVVFEDGCFGVNGNNSYEFISLFGLFKGEENSKTYIPNYGEVYGHYNAPFKIIGNTYEHPSLIPEVERE